jgi:hypothetical protein
MNNLHGAQRQVHSNSALALLVLPGLPELCTQEQTENALGTALFTLGQEVDGVRKAIRRGWSRAQADLRGLRDAKPGAAQPIDPWEIESLYGPNLRIEHDLIGIARFGVRDDPGYVALLHGGTWQELIRNGVIGRDSFEYVVANYWLVALKEQAAEAVKRSDAMARTLAIASSALSLLAVVLPPVAPVAVASDLALLAFTVYGAARQLGNLDDKLRIELPTLASGGYEALSAAGELAAEIPSIREQLTLEVLKQLALLPLSQIRLVGEVLNARAYVEDVITLIQASDGG